jgi:hypothetical protein
VIERASVHGSANAVPCSRAAEAVVRAIRQIDVHAIASWVAFEKVQKPIFLSWELIRADIAEAKFIELTVSQLMQFINHVVVPALESAIDSGRL